MALVGIGYINFVSKLIKPGVVVGVYQVKRPPAALVKVPRSKVCVHFLSSFLLTCPGRQ